MKYAAQFRDMHTAGHNLAICKTRTRACRILQHINAQESLDGFDFDSVSQIDTIAIDFRNPPDKYNGENLTIVNGLHGTPPGVPDCY